MGYVLAEGAGGEELCEEVEGAAARVDPGGVEAHDGAVAEGTEEVDLAVDALQVGGALQEEVVEAHLVPCHLDALPLVETPVPAPPPTTPPLIRQNSTRRRPGKSDRPN